MKKKTKRYSLFLEAFRINLFTVFTVVFLWTIIQAFDQFNPLDQIFNDFDYTDLYFANFLSKEVPPDTNIVIVNIGGSQFTRMDIANQINVLQKFEPKVIGIDAVFAERKGSEDFFLRQALNKKENIVLGVFGEYKDDNLVGYTRSNPFFGEFPFGHLEFQSYPKTTRDFEKYIVAYDTVASRQSDEIISNYFELTNPLPDTLYDENDSAFVVYPNKDSVIIANKANIDTIKSEYLFQVFYRKPPKGYKEVRINAFTTEIMRLYDSAKYAKYMKRNSREEIINYRGGTNPFIVLEAEDINDSNTNLIVIKDKIVLMGYVKQDKYAPGDTVDSHFTPLRKSQTGHADAKGIEIHAHILSMILSEKYINQWPGWTNYLWGILITQLFLMFFCYLYVYKNKYFDVISKPVQFLSLIIILWFTFFVFETFNFKIDMVPAVICMVLSIEVLYLYEESLELLRIRTYLTQYINFEKDESKIISLGRKISRYFRSLFNRNRSVESK